MSLIWWRRWDAAHWARYYPAQQMLLEFARSPNYQFIREAVFPRVSNGAWLKAEAAMMTWFWQKEPCGQLHVGYTCARAWLCWEA